MRGISDRRSKTIAAEVRQGPQFYGVFASHT